MGAACLSVVLGQGKRARNSRDAPLDWIRPRTGIDFAARQGDNWLVKSATLEMSVSRWPYALEIQPSKNGLLLRPRRKARAGWAKAFRHSPLPADSLGSFRELPNQFDLKDWQW